MHTRSIRAVDMAKGAGVNAKVFRAALRREGLTWHSHNEPWTVLEGSAEHADMRRVLAGITARGMNNGRGPDGKIGGYGPRAADCT